jgi:hypothetical protein
MSEGTADSHKHQGRKRVDVREYSEVMRHERPSRNPLAAYMPFPKVRVEIQDPDEQLIILVRRHIITNWKWIAVVMVMIFAPLLLASFPGLTVLPPRFQLMTLVFWWLLIAAVALEGFLNWYFDVFIITDERIIDIDFKNLIYKNITTTKLENIEDVTYSVSGAVPSLLDYGNVLIQTAGAGVVMQPSDTRPAIEIWNTPHPSRVSKLINELLAQEEQEKIEGRVR